MTSEQIVLAEIRKNIGAMPHDSQIRVEAIAATLRNILKGGGTDAAYALALVGAELAAE